MFARRSISTCVLVFLMAIGSAAADKTVSLPTELERSLVVTGQGYFPVALRLKDGRIAAVLRGGAGHLGIKGRLDIVFSEDEGKTWSKPIIVNDSPVDDRNPAMGQAANRDLIVGFWRTATYDEEGRYDPKLDKPRNTWITRSADGGKTWSDPTELDVSDIGWGSPYGKILTMPDGALLMAVYGGPQRPAGPKIAKREDHSYIYRSTDHGKSWSRYAECSIGGQFNETALLRLPSGKILAAMRSRRGSQVWLTGSTDDGKTWSEPKQVTPNNVHPADLVLLPDGRVLMATGYRVGPYGVRGLIGDANGNFDWGKRFLLIDDGIGGDCGYPSSVVLKDGRALTLYYANGSKDHPGWRVHCGALVYTPPSRNK
ncbi:MAG: hypothetical protein GWP08_21340 [Nitrospiraceae bacterium]|nr:hypothetical protein [Nitrospiraceae bacterium]